MTVKISNDLCVTPLSANSAHAPASCDFLVTPASNYNTIDSFLMYDYQNTDYVAFNNYLSQVDRGVVFSTCLSAIDFWKCFVDVLNRGIMLFVPVKKS